LLPIQALLLVVSTLVLSNTTFAAQPTEEFHVLETRLISSPHYPSLTHIGVIVSPNVKRNQIKPIVLRVIADQPIASPDSSRLIVNIYPSTEAVGTTLLAAVASCYDGDISILYGIPTEEKQLDLSSDQVDLAIRIHKLYSIYNRQIHDNAVQTSTTNEDFNISAYANMIKDIENMTMTMVASELNLTLEQTTYLRSLIQSYYNLNRYEHKLTLSLN